MLGRSYALDRPCKIDSRTGQCEYHLSARFGHLPSWVKSSQRIDVLELEVISL